MSTSEFSRGKTIFVLAIVIGCFAVLWPKIFYPMLTASMNQANGDASSVCCDVISEKDTNAYKVMNEICTNIIRKEQSIREQEQEQSKNVKKTPTSLKVSTVTLCRNEILQTCGVDIIGLLKEDQRITPEYKKSLTQLRTFNTSLCMKLNYGVDFREKGVSRKMKGPEGALSHMRQERPFRPGPDMVHPALRERGKAIPTVNIPRRTIEREARPGPVPGMRPPVGGAGHIPTGGPKGGGTMGIIMPMYTIGIVCFFLYTIMKILFKKSPESEQAAASVKPQIKDYGMDPEHRKYVFSEEYAEGSERSMKESISKEDRDIGLRRRSSGGKPAPSAAARFYEDRRKLEEPTVIFPTYPSDLETDPAHAEPTPTTDTSSFLPEEEEEVVRESVASPSTFSARQNYEESVTTDDTAPDTQNMPIESYESESDKLVKTTSPVPTETSPYSVPGEVDGGALNAGLHEPLHVSETEECKPETMIEINAEPELPKQVSVSSYVDMILADAQSKMEDEVETVASEGSPPTEKRMLEGSSEKESAPPISGDVKDSKDPGLGPFSPLVPDQTPDRESEAPHFFHRTIVIPDYEPEAGKEPTPSVVAQEAKCKEEEEEPQLLIVKDENIPQHVKDMAAQVAEKIMEAVQTDLKTAAREVAAPAPPLPGESIDHDDEPCAITLASQPRLSLDTSLTPDTNDDNQLESVSADVDEFSTNTSSPITTPATAPKIQVETPHADQTEINRIAEFLETLNTEPKEHEKLAANSNLMDESTATATPSMPIVTLADEVVKTSGSLDSVKNLAKMEITPIDEDLSVSPPSLPDICYVTQPLDESQKGRVDKSKFLRSPVDIVSFEEITSEPSSPENVRKSSEPVSIPTENLEEAVKKLKHVSPKESIDSGEGSEKEKSLRSRRKSSTAQSQDSQKESEIDKFVEKLGSMAETRRALIQQAMFKSSESSHGSEGDQQPKSEEADQSSNFHGPGLLDSGQISSELPHEIDKMKEVEMWASSNENNLENEIVVCEQEPGTGTTQPIMEVSEIPQTILAKVDFLIDQALHDGLEETVKLISEQGKVISPVSESVCEQLDQVLEEFGESVRRHSKQEEILGPIPRMELDSEKREESVRETTEQLLEKASSGDNNELTDATQLTDNLQLFEKVGRDTQTGTQEHIITSTQIPDTSMITQDNIVTFPPTTTLDEGTKHDEHGEVTPTLTVQNNRVRIAEESEASSELPASEPVSTPTSESSLKQSTKITSSEVVPPAEKIGNKCDVEVEQQRQLVPAGEEGESQEPIIAELDTIQDTLDTLSMELNEMESMNAVAAEKEKVDKEKQTAEEKVTVYPEESLDQVKGPAEEEKSLAEEKPEIEEEPKQVEVSATVDSVPSADVKAEDSSAPEDTSKVEAQVASQEELQLSNTEPSKIEEFVQISETKADEQAPTVPNPESTTADVQAAIEEPRQTDETSLEIGTPILEEPCQTQDQHVPGKPSIEPPSLASIEVAARPEDKINAEPSALDEPLIITNLQAPEQMTRTDESTQPAESPKTEELAQEGESTKPEELSQLEMEKSGELSLREESQEPPKQEETRKSYEASQQEPSVAEALPQRVELSLSEAPPKSEEQPQQDDSHKPEVPEQVVALNPESPPRQEELVQTEVSPHQVEPPKDEPPTQMEPPKEEPPPQVEPPKEEPPPQVEPLKLDEPSQQLESPKTDEVLQQDKPLQLEESQFEPTKFEELPSQVQLPIPETQPVPQQEPTKSREEVSQQDTLSEMPPPNAKIAQPEEMTVEQLVPELAKSDITPEEDQSNIQHAGAPETEKPPQEEQFSMTEAAPPSYAAALETSQRLADISTEKPKPELQIESSKTESNSEAQVQEQSSPPPTESTQTDSVQTLETAPPVALLRFEPLSEEEPPFPIPPRSPSQKEEHTPLDNTFTVVSPSAMVDSSNNQSPASSLQGQASTPSPTSPEEELAVEEDSPAKSITVLPLSADQQATQASSATTTHAVASASEQPGQPSNVEQEIISSAKLVVDGDVVPPSPGPPPTTPSVSLTEGPSFPIVQVEAKGAQPQIRENNEKSRESVVTAVKGIVEAFDATKTSPYSSVPPSSSTERKESAQTTLQPVEEDLEKLIASADKATKEDLGRTSPSADKAQGVKREKTPTKEKEVKFKLPPEEMEDEEEDDVEEEVDIVRPPTPPKTLSKTKPKSPSPTPEPTVHAPTPTSSHRDHDELLISSMQTTVTGTTDAPDTDNKSYAAAITPPPSTKLLSPSPPPLLSSQTEMLASKLVEQSAAAAIAAAKAASSPSPSSYGSERVSVVGIEETASLVSGERWDNRTPTPTFRQPTPPFPHRPPTPPERIPSIYLEGPMPVKGQEIIVRESQVEVEGGEDYDLDEDYEPSAPVILSGKVTLSVISSAGGHLCPDELTEAPSLSLDDRAQAENSKGSSRRNVADDIASAMREEVKGKSDGKKSSNASSPDMDEYEVIGKAGGFGRFDEDDAADVSLDDFLTATDAEQEQVQEDTAGDISTMEDLMKPEPLPQDEE